MARSGPPRSLGAPGLGVLAWAVAGLLLTGAFVLHGFPYDRLAAALSAAVAREGAFTLHLSELGPRLSPLGPGVRASGVRLGLPGGGTLRIDSLALRPAWSPRWLLLRPAFRIGAELAGGSADGTIGGEPSFDGELAGIDLAQLPLAALWPGSELSGSADAIVDLRADPAGPQGSISLAARDGSMTLPRVPLPLPFETLEALLALGGDAWLRVEALSLSGPGLVARGDGNVGAAASFAEAPLDLRLEIEAEPGVAAVLRPVGVRLGRDGRGSLRITGTPSHPALE